MRIWALFKSRRVMLFLGFGGMLAMILLLAWKGMRVISAIEQDNARLRTAYHQRYELLEGVRFTLSESSSDVRDFLLERDPETAARRRDEIASRRRDMAEALERYGRNLPADEAAPFEDLTRGIDSYWNALEPVFQWTPDMRHKRAEDFLHKQVIPRHRELLELADMVDRASGREVAASDRNVSRSFAQFRDELWYAALILVLLGAALAAFTVQRILALERQTQEQLREVRQARAELQTLSQRLVAAQEEERRRVARELHDEIGQALTAILVELGRLDSRLPAGQESHGLIAATRELAERAVAEVRNMALLLRPSMLDDLGLVPALKWQARETSRRTGMKVRVAADGVSDDLPDEFRTCIYRIVQEALNNASRHAGASNVRVDARQDGDQIRVSIQDDGAGFDPSQEKGMGIVGMEERVRTLGGVFRIDSERGGGTVVSLLLPLAKTIVAGGAS